MQDFLWFLERAERLGPWVLLLLYYFLRLDRQMEQVIKLLDDIEQNSDQISKLLSRFLHARR